MVHGGKSLYSVIKKLALMSALLFTVVGYQNCGGQTDNTGLFSNTEFDLNAQEKKCASVLVGCEPNPAYLQLQLHTPVPYNSPINNANNSLDVFGVCNDGDYPNNYLNLKLTNPSTGSVISEKNFEKGCVDGEFNLSLLLPVKTVSGAPQVDVTLGLDYELQVEIFGIDSLNRKINNPKRQSIDIITVRFYRAK